MYIPKIEDIFYLPLLKAVEGLGNGLLIHMTFYQPVITMMKTYFVTIILECVYTIP